MNSKNIYEFIDEIEKRPSMFLATEKPEDLEDLQSILYGYSVCLSVHNIIEENVPVFFRHFSTWLGKKNFDYLSLGWAYSIKKSLQDDENLLQKFFDLVRDFRKLQPKVVSYIHLKTHHNPTGKKIIIGHDELVEKPEIIQIIQYFPSSWYFLRFHYGENFVNYDHFHSSRLEAENWVNSEFNVMNSEWKLVS